MSWSLEPGRVVDRERGRKGIGIRVVGVESEEQAMAATTDELNQPNKAREPGHVMGAKDQKLLLMFFVFLFSFVL